MPTPTTAHQAQLPAIIAQQQLSLDQLCKRHHVARLLVFGSVTRPDFDPSRSDIDFWVEFKPIAFSEYASNYFAFAEALAKLFTQPIDLISGEIRNPIIRSSVYQDQQEVYVDS
jgi:uncharacterized protein